MALNVTLRQFDLIDIYKAFHLKTADNTYFLSVPGTFSKVDYIIGYKTSLNKHKKINIISAMFSDQNGMKLESIAGGKLKKSYKCVEIK